MTIKKLSIIIPAYNEAATIHRILDKIKDVFNCDKLHELISEHVDLRSGNRFLMKVERLKLVN